MNRCPGYRAVLHPIMIGQSLAMTASGSDAPRLRFGEVHVWVTPLSESMPVIDLLAGYLDSAEQDRSRSFYFSADRDRYIAAHGVLRSLLGVYTGLEPGAIRITTSPLGKPGLGGMRRWSGLTFNMSHDADLALIGLTRAAPVGIDVQSYATPSATALGIDAVESTKLAEPGSVHQAIRHWVRKESVVKALGTGIDDRFDQLEVGGPSPVSIAAAHRRFLARLIVQDLNVDPRYAAAVATPRWCRRVVQQVWRRPR